MANLLQSPADGAIRAVCALAAWLAPARCASCDECLEDADLALGFCEICAISLLALESACPRCAEPLGPSAPTTKDGEVLLECGRCRNHRPPQRSTIAPFEYGGELAAALRLLKHERRRDIARTLAPLFAPHLQAAVERTGATLIVPVPLAARRMASRGFNQSATLARMAARHLPAIPVDTISLRRHRNTAPQAGLSRTDRTANVRGAFRVARRHHARLRGQRVLLFDDIVTTGATVRAAGEALKLAGVETIDVFACARAGDPC